MSAARALLFGLGVVTASAVEVDHGVLLIPGINLPSAAFPLDPWAFDLNAEVVICVIVDLAVSPPNGLAHGVGPAMWAMPFRVCLVKPTNYGHINGWLLLVQLNITGSHNCSPVASQRVDGWVLHEIL